MVDLFGRRVYSRKAYATRIPVLLVKIGNYPLHHGGVGAIRSLGRLGIPVHAIIERRTTPAALSRHLRGSYVWPTTGAEDPDRLVDGLIAIGAAVAAREGRRALALPTDDEAAILLAEHAAELKGVLDFPGIAPELPRELSGKQSLHELCTACGIPSPRSALPTTVEELALAARELRFPLVAKNSDAFHRLHRPAVGSSTVLADPAALDRLVGQWPSPLPRVLLQEYLPGDQAEDWICQLYCGSADDGSRDLVFTGVKVRAWPPRGGVTAHAYTADNPELAALSARFCRAVGFRGICDLDWRLDLRDGCYKLLDFNPRLGAQFRMFQTDRGVDLVRALHLDLGGRDVDYGTPVAGRRFTVEFLDAPARVAAARGRRSARLPTGPSAPPRRSTAHELAWTSADDPLPTLAAAAHAAAHAAHLLRGRLRPEARPGSDATFSADRR